MTQILSILSVDYINNSNYVCLAKPFGIISDVLIKHGLRQVGWELRPPGHEDEFWAPLGFVFDFESTPNWLRGPLGENKRGGATHDPICRKNVLIGRGLTPDELALLSDPNTSKEDVIKITLRAKGKITKSIAADVYKEIMDYCDSKDVQRFESGKHLYIPDPLIMPYVKTKDWIRRWLKSTVVRYWPGDFFQKYEMTATSKEMYGIESDPYATIQQLKTEIKAEDAKIVTAQAAKVEVAAVLDAKPLATTEDVKIADAKTVVLDTKIDVAVHAKDEKIAKIADIKKEGNL